MSFTIVSGIPYVGVDSDELIRLHRNPFLSSSFFRTSFRNLILNASIPVLRSHLKLIQDRGHLVRDL